ncbi:MAG TPA: guanylate kinase [Acidobacteriota bacterium]|nr:guanylate kinase [Acidobacteriota bacterium]
MIVSGPSGAGKSALVAKTLKAMPRLNFSVSYTTRAPRGNECNGAEYFFVDRGTFLKIRDRGEFLEWAEVHGNYYGTSRTFVDMLIQNGDDVILDIDVQGAHIIRGERPDAVAVFVLPPSYKVLRDRLRGRRLDDESVIEKRLQIACREISRYKEYDYLIVNENLDHAAKELESIVLSSRCRLFSRIDAAMSILETFGGMDAKDT